MVYVKCEFNFKFNWNSIPFGLGSCE